MSFGVAILLLLRLKSVGQKLLIWGNPFDERPFSGRFFLLLSLSTGCSNARFCNDRAKIRRSEFVIFHVLDEFSEVVGDEDAFLPQQAKLVADPWLDRNLHDVFRKGHCRVEEGTTVAGRKTVEDCRQLAAVHFDMRSCSFGTEAGDDGVRLDGVRIERMIGSSFSVSKETDGSLAR